jgi:hypothetical protein
MKKIYTLIAVTAVVFSANGQTRATHATTDNHSSNRQVSVNPAPSTRALGDTLMWFPAPGVYCFDAADAAAFEIAFEDIDGLTTYNAGAPTDYAMYYSTNTDVNGLGNPTSDNFYHPYEDPMASPDPDTAWFWGATSWFNPAGQADNWFMMGPVTIPATGTYQLKWYDRTNPAYRDGYKVILSTTAVGGALTFTDFTDPAIYTKTDAYPSPTYTTDTTWVLRTVTIPAMYSGMIVYIAFQHNANDMDVLYLDDFTVAAPASGVGINEFVNGVRVSQNMPNPFSTVSTISYELDKSANVSLSVYDVTGKKVAEQSEGTQTTGFHTISFDGTDLAAGVYHYSLQVNENTTSAMKMVIVK